MSARRKALRQLRRRLAAATAFVVVRQIHGCRCVVDVRHRPDRVTYLHDDGCPLIGRRQYVIVPGGHR